MKPHRDKKYLAFVRTQPCFLEGPGCKGRVEAHHAFGQYTGGGKGLKGSDYLAVPLCTKHHAAVHSKGQSPKGAAYMLSSAMLCLVEFVEASSTFSDEMTKKLLAVTIGSAARAIADSMSILLHEEPPKLKKKVFSPTEAVEDASPLQNTPPHRLPAPEEIIPEYPRVDEFAAKANPADAREAAEMMKAMDAPFTVMEAFKAFRYCGLNSCIHYVDDSKLKKVFKFPGNIPILGANGEYYVVVIENDRGEIYARKRDGLNRR